MTIGERIRNRRSELDMTQDELAKKVGYKSRSSINKIELSRDLPLKKIEQVSKALDITPAQLCGWDEEYTVQDKNSEIYKIEVDSSCDKNHLLKYATLLPTLFELDIIKAYRELDQFDKVNALRALHMNTAAEREKKIHSS